MATSRRTHLVLVTLIMGAFAGLQEARSEPFATAFTYQAQLDQGGSPLNDSVDLRFNLFAVEIDGAPIGTPVAVTNLAVTDGTVAVGLDFGVDVFDGGARWLEVAIRSPHDPSDTLPFTTLNPRQPISPIPYALQTRGIFVNEAGEVSVGTAPAPNRALAQPPSENGQLHAEAAPGQLVAIHGNNPATSDDAVGIMGTTSSAQGRGMKGVGPSEGVLGHASDPSGLTKGVRGKSDSPGGTGVEGEGGAKGIHGRATAPGGTGVEGEGEAKGIHGRATAPGSTGVEGEGEAKGIHGRATAAGSTGVEGEGIAKGIHGRATAPGSTGVEGEGGAKGMHGRATAPGGTGVEGEGEAKGIHGRATAPGGTGVDGLGGGVGVQAEATEPGGTGVMATASAASGAAVGILAECISPDGFAGYFLGRGYFSSDVGIGTTSMGFEAPPMAPLHVRSGGPPWLGLDPTMIVESEYPGGMSLSLRNLVMGFWHEWNLVSTRIDGAPDRSELRFVSVDGQQGPETVRMVIQDTGRVGIGDFSPTGNPELEAQLHVIGNGPTPDSPSMIIESDNDEGTGLSLRNTSQSGHDWILVSGGGPGPGGDKAFRFVDGPQLGAPARMIIQESGRVGIGTESPTSTLDVNGTCTMQGIKLSTSPSVGRVLTSDASGNGTWQPLPAASGNWTTTGNAGTNSATNFVGTTDAQGLSLRTNGLARMTIAANGNVGVGTTSPSAKLHVAGLPGVDGIRFPDGTLQTSAGVVGGDSTPDTIADDGVITDAEASNILTIDNGLLYAPTTGNVGIGTTNPIARLNVLHDIDGGGGARIDNSFGSANAVGALTVASTVLSNPSLGTSLSLLSYNWSHPVRPGSSTLVANSSSASLDLVANGGSAPIRFFAGGNYTSTAIELMRITDVGNVGIGTATPTEKLHVVGGLRVTGLTSTANAANVQVDANGKFFISTSSRRYKENITPLMDGFDRLLQTQAVTYTRSDRPDQSEIGWIAEDVHDLGLTNLVFYDEQNRPKGISYEKACVYLTEIAKLQAMKIENLEAENEKIKSQLAPRDDLEARLARLEAVVVQLLAERKDGE